MKIFRIRSFEEYGKGEVVQLCKWDEVNGGDGDDDDDGDVGNRKKRGLIHQHSEAIVERESRERERIY
ncbi:unnamed protein product [Dracunculus medinensis]|uniref:Uncharacterized protein n=1 Tax=Dracunculus medinensis TaxID=318479 RepID=A0A0N4U3F3_DRAME|nr:unnamed protein product [Dracunculus medinensis]